MSEGLETALYTMPKMAPIALGASGAWFAVAFMGHQSMIDNATQARSVTKREEPRAYKLLENLCISRGITTPRLKIMETPVMNAYASGLSDKNYTVALTRGLMDNLDDQELEAVIAHELSHIENRDVRTMVIAVIFVGIFAFFGQNMMRRMFRLHLHRGQHHRRSGGGNSGALIFFAIGIMVLTYFFAISIRFALSRRREYIADAGAVELTKNPDAMIRALKKISGRATLDNVPAEVREMAIENPRTGFAGLFATHPPIEKRIEALVKYAAGREGTRSKPHSNHHTKETDRTQQAARKKSPFGKRNPWSH
ncbi:MAG: M48 family metallopeptidase [Maricaulaceae bacterium]